MLLIWKVWTGVCFYQLSWSMCKLKRTRIDGILLKVKNFDSGLFSYQAWYHSGWSSLQFGSVLQNFAYYNLLIMAQSRHQVHSSRQPSPLRGRFQSESSSEEYNIAKERKKQSLTRKQKKSVVIHTTGVIKRRQNGQKYIVYEHKAVPTAIRDPESIRRHARRSCQELRNKSGLRSRNASSGAQRDACQRQGELQPSNYQCQMQPQTVMGSMAGIQGPPRSSPMDSMGQLCRMGVMPFPHGTQAASAFQPLNSMQPHQPVQSQLPTQPAAHIGQMQAFPCLTPMQSFQLGQAMQTPLMVNIKPPELSQLQGLTPMQQMARQMIFPNFGQRHY